VSAQTLKAQNRELVKHGVRKIQILISTNANNGLKASTWNLNCNWTTSNSNTNVSSRTEINAQKDATPHR